VLLECARAALEIAPGLQFAVLGYTIEMIVFATLITLGSWRYAEAELHDRLIDLAPTSRGSRRCGRKPIRLPCQQHCCGILPQRSISGDREPLAGDRVASSCRSNSC